MGYFSILVSVCAPWLAVILCSGNLQLQKLKCKCFFWNGQCLDTSGILMLLYNKVTSVRFIPHESTRDQHSAKMHINHHMIALLKDNAKPPRIEIWKMSIRSTANDKCWVSLIYLLYSKWLSTNYFHGTICLRFTAQLVGNMSRFLITAKIIPYNSLCLFGMGNTSTHQGLSTIMFVCNKVTLS